LPHKITALAALAALLISSSLLAGCAKAGEHKYTLYVFGTLVEFILYDNDQARDDKVMKRLAAGFQRRHRDWHAWQRGGELSRLNKAIAKGYPLKVSREMMALIRQGRNFENLSRGKFNPAIGRLIALWGFHSDGRPQGPPPSRQEIARLAGQHPSMNDLRFRDQLVISSNRAVQLDFGGFAKGAALDWAAGVLKKAGIKNAIINAGGDLNVIGMHGKRRWKLGIRHPRHWGAIASLELDPDEVLYTSGNYFRYREDRGRRYSHIIDPRNGWPVDHIVSASVIHKNGALADAAATALSVAGPRHWLETARSMGLREVLLVDDHGGLHMTPAMKRRVKITDPAARIVEIADPFARESASAGAPATTASTHAASRHER